MATDGAVVITEQISSSMKLVKFSWTSGADGGVNGFTTANAFDGELCLAVTVPGSPAPTSYTVQILDNNGVDLLAGTGTTRSTSNTEYLTKPKGAVAWSTLQLVITGAGSGAKGVVYTYIR